MMDWTGNDTKTSRLAVYDLSSPTLPKYLGSAAVPVNGWQVEVTGAQAIVLTQDGTSVTFLDVGDPTHMHVITPSPTMRWRRGSRRGMLQSSMTGSLAAVA